MNGTTACKWDSVIPFDAMWDKLIKDGIKVDLTVTSPPYDNLRTYKGSLVWNESIWKQVIEKLYDITARGGVVVWVVGDATVKGSETGTSFKQALYFKECGFRLHDTMIYAKNNPIPLTHNRCEQYFEYMFVFSKDKPKTFNPIKIDVKTPNKKYKWKAKETGSSKRERSEVTLSKTTKIIGNIWNYSLNGNRIGSHPAPFPEKLANDHIISWSNEVDTVFDPFMGSGTTGKMALLNHREFMGIEKIDEYFEIAKNRIENTGGV